MLAHLSGNVRKHLVLAVFQLNPKHSVRQSFQHLCHDFYRLFLRHNLSDWNFASADKLRIITCPFSFAKPPYGYQLTAARPEGKSLVEATLVSTSGPSSVMAMVCSAWALGKPSTVTTVHLSASTLVWWLPLFTIGSIANT